ncbi:MAG: cytidylate kinase-like family protein [Agathobacter sp.]|nr:cytidylate kinase-like family protein [Agathobacter sp.]
MDKQFIVAIGREFGSGGHEIGKQLAAKLGVNFYDRNLLDHMWDGLDIDADEFEKYDEKSKTPFLTRRVRGHSSSIEDNLAHLQFEFIKEKANSGESFVIVGRCAEAVLRNHPGLISVFIMADEPFKLKRIEEKFDLSPRKAENKMVRHDYNRKKYHNTYSQFKWGDSRGYDICMNSARLDIEGTVESLYRYVQDRRANL